jgi:hypothetical protein
MFGAVHTIISPFTFCAYYSGDFEELVDIHGIGKLFHGSSCWVQYIPGVVHVGMDITDFAELAGSERIKKVASEDFGDLFL